VKCQRRRFEIENKFSECDTLQPAPLARLLASPRRFFDFNSFFFDKLSRSTMSLLDYPSAIINLLFNILSHTKDFCKLRAVDHHHLRIVSGRSMHGWHKLITLL